ncbi:MAG: metalloregulator ArsR/SmtB family transcription factor [Planctomycetota bacterium]
MRPPSSAGPREKLLFHLKTKGPQTAAQLARRLGVTSTAARQHLSKLAGEGLVDFEDLAGQVGRPRREWRVTQAADERFPNSHAELTVGLIDAAREAFGDAGVKRLIDRRTAAQAKDYAARMPPPAAPLGDKVAALTAIRREEGYLAEWSRAGDGFRLVEHHCPICVAAEACVGLCAGELSLFRRVLGPGVEVVRTEYLLDGDLSCAYRIEAK